MFPFIVNGWTAEQGAPEESIDAVVQTRDGYLWLGSFSGLVRFDGVAFRRFTPGNTAGVTSTRIHSLHEDRHGTLWVGTVQDGVFMLRDGTIWIGLWPGGAVRLRGDRIQPFRPVGIGQDALVSAIHEDEAGIMRVATATGFFRIVGERAELVRLGDRVEQPSVRSITPHPRGGFWLASTDGLWHLNGGEQTFYGVANGLAEDNVQTVSYDREGNLWVAPRSAGLQRLSDPRALSFRVLNQTRLELPRSSAAGCVRSVCQTAAAGLLSRSPIPQPGASSRPSSGSTDSRPSSFASNGSRSTR